jgi:hypothetical protein
LLIALKEVAVARASNAGHPHLADKVFHLRALRALGTFFTSLLAHTIVH